MSDVGTATNDVTNIDNTEGTQKTVFVVGEHSVYNSVEDLLEGAKQKEAYIAELIKANKELQAKYDSLEKNNNLVDELKQFRKDTLEGKVKNMDATNTTVDNDTIKEIALKAMQEEAAKKAAAANLNDCINAVAKVSGDAELALKNKANELGVSEEYLKDIAQTSPKAFKSMFGIKESAPVVNTDFLQSTKQVSTETKNDIDFKAMNSPRAVAALMERALKDPSILDNIKW